jgi:pectate lyase
MRRIFTRGLIPLAAAFLGLLLFGSELPLSDTVHSVIREVAIDRPGYTIGDATSTDARSEGGVAVGCPELRAFPGAEGFGAFTPGGRGGQVIEVTNLEQSGPGSLQDALDTIGRRIIVFRVGGTIETNKPIRIREPYVTIAGQTAPGGGIAIRGAGLSVSTHNVIVRGVRIRVGDDPAGPRGDNRDGLAINNKNEPPHDIIVDHSSISWAIDENISVWNSAHDITVQWSITSEALHDSLHRKGPHSKGLLIGPGGHRISIHHNLFAHNASRNPKFSDDTSSEIVNNVIYNWSESATDLSNCHSNTPSFSNVIGNHYRAGISTTSDWSIEIGDCWVDGKVFVRGNIGPLRPTDTGDDWLLVNNAAGDQGRSDAPALDSTGITSQGVDEAYDLVLAHAGAIVPARDPVDERIIQSVRDHTGSVINSQSDVGGWPTLVNRTPPRDEDRDGIPDTWESVHGLDPSDPADASKTTACGYSWIEEYVNSLIPMP